MSGACTLILVGVVSSVSEIKLAYGSLKWKNLIDRNRLKKLMQLGVVVTCMCTSFGGCGLFGFGDMTTFQKWPNFPFGAWNIVHGHQKFNRSESAQKIMQLGIDVTCMCTSFGGRGLFGFGDMATFQKRPNFPFGAWTIVHGHREIQSIGIGSKNSCK